MEQITSFLLEMGPFGGFFGVFLWYIKQRELEHREERETWRGVIERQHGEGMTLQRETNTILQNLTEHIKDATRKKG